MELALSESMDCLLLHFPFTESIDGHTDVGDSFSSLEQEDESLDVSQVCKIIKILLNNKYQYPNTGYPSVVSLDLLIGGRQTLYMYKTIDSFIISV
jgi:hypothetical protein